MQFSIYTILFLTLDTREKTRKMKDYLFLGILKDVRAYLRLWITHMHVCASMSAHTRTHITTRD